MQNQAWISTPDFRLFAGDIQLELDENKKMKTLNATGGVRLQAIENNQPVTATAARAWQPQGSTVMTLFGQPLATLKSEEKRCWANVLTFDQTHHKFTAAGTDRPVKMIFNEPKKDNRHSR
jgi:hypothetical protein